MSFDTKAESLFLQPENSWLKNAEKYASPEKFLLGEDVIAETNSGGLELVSGNSIDIKLKVPIGYFDKLIPGIKPEEELDLTRLLLTIGNFSERSVLGQSGAVILASNKLSERKFMPAVENNTFVFPCRLYNFHHKATFIVPDNFPAGRLFIPPKPLTGSELKEAADMSIIGDYKIDQDAVLLPILKTGISEAEKIDLASLISERSDLDIKLRLNWGDSSIDSSHIEIGETTGTKLDGVAMVIRIELEGDFFHSNSIVVEPGWGITILPDSEKGTPIRTEYVKLVPGVRSPQEVRANFFSA